MVKRLACWGVCGEGDRGRQARTVTDMVRAVMYLRWCVWDGVVWGGVRWWWGGGGAGESALVGNNHDGG